ncbi:MAG: lipase secretion chaperone [Pseudomonadota bacterium]
MMTTTKWIWTSLALACLMLLGVTVPRGEAPAVQADQKVAVRDTAVLQRPAQVKASQGAQQWPTQREPLPAVETAVGKARAGGAGEDEVYRLRAAALSTQTIARLTEREEAEKHWLLRLAAWRAERALINQADPAALQALRERLFSADERTRLDANEPVTTPTLILR